MDMVKQAFPECPFFVTVTYFPFVCKARKEDIQNAGNKLSLAVGKVHLPDIVLFVLFMVHDFREADHVRKTEKRCIIRIPESHQQPGCRIF